MRPALVRLALVLTPLLALAHVAGQELRCLPASVCNRPVEFLPTAGELAGGALLTPLETAPQMRLQRRNDGSSHVLTGELEPSGWSDGLELEAQYTVSNDRGKDATVLPWRRVAAGPREIVGRDDQRTRIAVAYRLRVVGPVAAGSYRTTVRYASQNALDPSAAPEVATHEVVAELPGFLLLRVEDAAGAAVEGATVTAEFHYDGTRALDYVRAVTSDRPLPPTGGDLGRVAVATNAPEGYVVFVSVALVEGPTGAGLGAGDLLLQGARADGMTFTGGPTDGFETLLEPDRLALRVTGDELPGTYRLVVTYEARPAP